MRLLMLSVYMKGLVNAWEEAGFEVLNPAQYHIVDMCQEDAIRTVAGYEQQGHIDYAFSYNFYPELSDVCQVMGIIYIAWIMDAPHLSLFTASVYNEVNRFFAFDHSQYEMLIQMGCEHSWHLPLCTDADLFGRIISEEGEDHRKAFEADVAFVGSLYDLPPHNLYDQISYLPQYLRGYLDGLMHAQKQIWGADIIGHAIPEQIYKEIQKYVRLDVKSTFLDGYYKAFFDGMLHQKITQLERRELCWYLADHFQFALYTRSDTSFHSGIQNRGSVDYRTEMPLVFHNSRVNLNVTLHSIETGIPQRVMDILACGGFCLTNYQAEMAEYFVDGEELVMYSDFEDMYEKIGYYLEHDKERKEIAALGCQKVRDQFGFGSGVGRMLTVL